MSFKKLGVISALALGMTAGLAQAGSFYAGGNIGKATTKDWFSDAEFAELTMNPPQSTTEDSDTAFKVYAGLTMNDNVDFRAGYANLGEVTARASGGSDFYQLTGESQAIFVDALAKFKPTNQLALFAKIGISYTQTELSTQENVGFLPIIEEDNSEIVFVPGIGVAFDVTPSLGLVAEYERYLDGAQSEALDAESDIDVLTVGAYFHF